MQPITTLYLVPIVSLSISINNEFIDSESFPILRSSLSWYCRDSCIYRHTPPPLFFGYNLVQYYNESYCIAREPRGKPALSCCKRLCLFIHSNNTPGSLLGWTTLQIFYWMSGILTFVALPQVGVKHIRKI